MNLPSGEKYVGFSAQEVQKVMPEGVSVNAKGYLMLNQDVIITALVNSVKDLKTQNDTLLMAEAMKNLEVWKLKQENERMNAKNKELEARLKKIEAKLGID